MKYIIFSDKFFALGLGFLYKERLDSMINMEYNIINIKTMFDKDFKYGGLSVVEGEKDIPFAIKRIYCVHSTEQGLHRGYHAHKKNWQLLFCPYGKIDIIIDNGSEKETITLDNPSIGLILHPGLWREMIWKQDNAVLCVAASEYYNASEYIRDYDEFLRFAKIRE